MFYETNDHMNFCYHLTGKSGSPPNIPSDATLQFDIELIHFSEYDDVYGTDGHVQKRCIAEGEGWKKPKDTDVCQLKMKVFLEETGTLIQEIGGEKPEEYIVNSSKAPGIAKAIKDMKKGEKSEFLIAPTQGYGNNGNDDLAVPPNAKLKTEIELVDIIEIDDINSDGGILVKKIVEGEGYKNPKDLGTAKFHYKLALVDGTTIKDSQTENNGEPISHVIDEGELPCCAIELAVKKMKKGGKSEVRISPKYAFGDAGSEQFGVPAKAEILGTVELVSFENEKESWELHDNEEKLQVAQAKKVLGNERVKIKDFEKAARRYENAKDVLTSDYSFTEEQKEKSKELKVSIWTNLAMCQDKLGQADAALTSCNEALKLDPKTVKALYRRGCIESARGNEEKASTDLKAANAQEPENIAIKKALAALKKHRAVQDANDRKTLGGMFDKFAAKDALKDKKGKKKQKVKEMPSKTKPAKADPESESANVADDDTTSGSLSESDPTDVRPQLDPSTDGSGKDKRWIRKDYERECEKRGLSATGTIDELKTRLGL